MLKNRLTYLFSVVLCCAWKGRDTMTTLENFYFGNINPSEYKQSKDTRKKLSELTGLLDELKALLTTEQQKEKLEQIDNCQLSLIALSERDANIEGFKLGVKMTTEIFSDTQQRWGRKVSPLFLLVKSTSGHSFFCRKDSNLQSNERNTYERVLRFTAYWIPHSGEIKTRATGDLWAFVKGFWRTE